MSSFHIDHIVPKNLVDDPQKFEETKAKLNLGPSCELTGFGNLLPCKPGVNGQMIDRLCFWIKSFGKYETAMESKGKVSYRNGFLKTKFGARLTL